MQSPLRAGIVRFLFARPTEQLDAEATAAGDAVKALDKSYAPLKAPDGLEAVARVEGGDPLRVLVKPPKDRDGIFEVREAYEGGRLSALTVDQDGDGRPEIVVPVFMKVWAGS